MLVKKKHSIIKTLSYDFLMRVYIISTRLKQDFAAMFSVGESTRVSVCTQEDGTQEDGTQTHTHTHTCLPDVVEVMS